MLTRRRLGVPIQPRRFFRLLRERLLGTGLAFVVSAYRGDVAVASAVFSAWNGTLVFKYGARDDRWARLGANHLLMWSAIRWAAENGCHTVDLGRSALGQPELRRFKSGWGAREEPLAYTWIGNAPRPGGSRPFEAALAVLIRNSSPWVCRAMGELFYLDDLAEDCAADRIYEVFFVAVPLDLPGGIGSPANAVANVRSRAAGLRPARQAEAYPTNARRLHHLRWPAGPYRYDDEDLRAAPPRCYRRRADRLQCLR